ncbi:MAG: macro domain-containing protein, partial [bacterium]
RRIRARRLDGSDRERGERRNSAGRCPGPGLGGPDRGPPATAGDDAARLGHARLRAARAGSRRSPAHGPGAPGRPRGGHGRARFRSGRRPVRAGAGHARHLRPARQRTIPERFMTGTVITVVTGNIVGQPDCDGVVNAANASLMAGSGVCGAIHAAAGPRLEPFARRFAPLRVGDALATPGFDLPGCRLIIHTVGPKYFDDRDPPIPLARAMQSAI